MASNEATKKPDYVGCPFCKEGEYDLVGLKAHFSMAYCDVYEKTLTIDEEAELRRAGKL